MSELRKPTFAEREGAKPLPTQLNLKQVSSEVRAKTWSIIYKSMDQSKIMRGGYSYADRWASILQEYWVNIDHKFEDEFKNRLLSLVSYVNEKMSGEYSTFFEFLEHVVQHPRCPERLHSDLNRVLAEAGCAYRIYEKAVVPISSPEMGEAVSSAFEALAEFSGARSHLSAAAKFLSEGDYGGSVRESIHAVEAVARKIVPDATSLTPTLAAIERSHHLHPALKKGFSSLYGYTSDEDGVRHALIDNDQPNVTEADALYMFGSCASFAGYLSTYARTAMTD